MINKIIALPTQVNSLEQYESYREIQGLSSRVTNDMHIRNQAQGKKGGWKFSNMLLVQMKKSIQYIPWQKNFITYNYTLRYWLMHID